MCCFSFFSNPVTAASLLPPGSAVVVRLLVDEEREFSLTFPNGYPSVAELYAAFLSATGGDRSSLLDRIKLYFRLPSGAHVGVGSSATALDWKSYQRFEPHTYVARIATRTPPSSPERPADAARAPKKQSTVADLCAALEKVALSDDGMRVKYFYSYSTNLQHKY